MSTTKEQLARGTAMEMIAGYGEAIDEDAVEALFIKHLLQVYEAGRESARQRTDAQHAMLEEALRQAQAQIEAIDGAAFAPSGHRCADKYPVRVTVNLEVFTRPTEPELYKMAMDANGQLSRYGEVLSAVAVTPKLLGDKS